MNHNHVNVGLKKIFLSPSDKYRKPIGMGLMFSMHNAHRDLPQLGIVSNRYLVDISVEELIYI